MASSRLLIQGSLFDPVRLPSKRGKCERCEFHTALYWSPTGSVAIDAHPGYWMCDYCDEEHQDYWKEMWDDYYSGLL